MVYSSMNVAEANIIVREKEDYKEGGKLPTMDVVSNVDVASKVDTNKMITVKLTGCENGIGMKIAGGVDQNGNFTGIFVKSILENSLIARTGKVHLGDMIYSVNGHVLMHCSHADTMSIIRQAAATGDVELVVDNSIQAQVRFLKIFEQLTQFTSTHYTKAKIPRGENNASENTANNGLAEDDEKLKSARIGNISIDSGSGDGHAALSSTDSGILGSSTFMSPCSDRRPSSPSTSHQKEQPISPNLWSVTVYSRTSLGLGILLHGGIDDEEMGPRVRIAEIAAGSDADKNGHLHVGDFLMSVNDESFAGLTNQQANALLSRVKLRGNVMNFIVSFADGGHPMSDDSPPRQQQPSSSASSTAAMKKYHTRGRQSSKSRLPSTISIGKHKTLQSVPISNTPERHNVSLPGNGAQLPDTPKSSSESSSRKHSGSMSDKENVGGIKKKVILKELMDVMADMQDSDEDEEEESDPEDVFLPRAILPKVLFSTPNSRAAHKRFKLSAESPPENTISHFLKRDVRRRNYNNGEVSLPKKIKRSPSLALEANTSIKLEKLEGALQHLGVSLTTSQKSEIRRRLQADINDTVIYGDFVETARSVLGMNSILDRSESLNAESITFQKTSVTEEQQQTTTVENMPLKTEEAYRTRNEIDNAYREAEYYRKVLEEKDDEFSSLEDELEHTKYQLASVRREYNIMRRQTHKFLESHKNGRHSNRDVDKKIERLTKENSMLRLNPPSSEQSDTQKRLVIVGCQLRKAEVSKRTYEVAVEKLTGFVERVHLQLRDASKDSKNTSKKQMKIQAKLSKEAKQAVQSVKMLLEEEPLPLGWEEVYTPEGSRYYMNHLTQTTSWAHPITHVFRKPVQQESSTSSSKQS